MKASPIQLIDNCGPGRVERDTMGEMPVPAGALYGAQTARAVENFPISGRGIGRAMIGALGRIKGAAANVNRELGLLEPSLAEAIADAAHEVADGMLDEHFPVDVFQTGSGTSSNMNANEVIAARANRFLGFGAFRGPIHPNDHVNLGQSSNDVFPTAIHIAALAGLERDLGPALRRLSIALREKAVEFDDIVKTGRTHLQDAMPVRLGQEFAGYAAQVEAGIERLASARAGLRDLAIGGTAVGTGAGTHPEFSRRMTARLSEDTGLELREARDHFAAQGSLDAAVHASGTLRTIAVSLLKIANDVRWLGSGPRLGLGELWIPPVQPGSSMMPGKVNPVIAESLMMTCVQVIGNDTAVAIAGQYGAFELNTMMPLVARNLLESIEILSHAVAAFTEKLVIGLQADRDRIREQGERSLALATALAPMIGYDAAADIAKEASVSGRTVREVAMRRNIAPPDVLDRILDPARLTEPGR